ncbi:MAG: hypothetical protein P8Y53_22265 [Pseudolabrys sp.]
MCQVTMRVFAFQVRLAVPLPDVFTGGTCWEPLSETLNDMGTAVAVPAQAMQATPASAKTARLDNADVITDVITHSFDRVVPPMELAAKV